jgi:CheY-like chemotaxis protein
MKEQTILFVDDEDRNTVRYREQLEKLGRVEYRRGADEALDFFSDKDQLESLSLVVLDLAMYTGKSMTEKQTGYGRITGDALRKELRKYWQGPVIVLSNSPDQGIRSQIEEDGDVFCRKPLTTPNELRRIVESRLASG